LLLVNIITNSFLLILQRIHVCLRFLLLILILQWIHVFVISITEYKRTCDINPLGVFQQDVSFFGPNKVLAQKPEPWRINFLLDLASRGWKKISHNIK